MYYTPYMYIFIFVTPIFICITPLTCIVRQVFLLHVAVRVADAAEPLQLPSPRNR